MSQKQLSSVSILAKTHPEGFDFYCPSNYNEDMSKMNLLYRGLLERSQADSQSRLLGESLRLNSALQHEHLKAEGYGKLHQDLVGRMRNLADQNVSLENQLKMRTLEVGNLKSALGDADCRMNAMKANLGNYSNELLVLLSSP